MKKRCIGMIDTKTYKQEPNQNKSPPKYISPVHFHNIDLDFIHVNKNLRNGEVTSKLPIILQNDETPSVV